MASDLRPPILLADRRRPSHHFNDEVIGGGRDYVNEVSAHNPCIIKINVAIPWNQHPLLFLHLIQVACRVSTDTGPTIFQGDIANRLNLQPVNPFLRRVTTFLGSYTGVWCSHELRVGLGPGYMPLDVWFPVQPGHHGWEWRPGFPQWNVLGMTDVLNRRMLCATSEQVYAFERL